MSQDSSTNLFNQMCYELLLTNKNAKVYTELLQKQLMFPVAIAGKDISFTWLHEGRNDFIRNMLNAANKHANDLKEQAEGKPKNIQRTRKAK